MIGMPVQWTMKTKKVKIMSLKAFVQNDQLSYISSYIYQAFEEKLGGIKFNVPNSF